MILRKLALRDLEGMLEWMHDPEICKQFREGIEYRSVEEVTAFIQEADIQFRDGADVHFAVADDGDEYLGTISLKNINLRDKNAEYAVSLRKKAQGIGVARLATEELLSLAFQKYGLHKVYLNVLSDNSRAIKFYEKVGFSLEGEAKDHLFLRGAYRSLRWYAIFSQ